MKSARVAILGCGHWGKNLARNFAELDALAAVVDPDAAVSKAQSELHNVDAMSLEEALASDIDAVVIAAPAEMHCNLALKAIQAGKHVYVEKPIALSVADGERMINAATNAGKILMVGHLLRYHPVFVKLESMVKNGDLGLIRYAYSHRLSTGKFRVEEDAFWSLAPHDISMLLAIFGESPSQVRQSGLDFVTNGVADEARLDLVYPSGGRAHVFASWLHPFKEQRLVIVGETAMAVFDDVKPWPEKLAMYRHQIDASGNVPLPIKADVEYIEVPHGEPLKAECQHFLDCIATGSPPRTDGKEALEVLRVMASDSLPKPI